jgi:hypothetical protein
MEATRVPEEWLSGGELIVQNGHHSGARRPLEVPITIIGGAAGCDLRLNVPEVEPIHCVLASTSDGVTLRDLRTRHGTLVNGVPAHILTLQDGDIIDIGPLRLQLRLAVPDGAAERDALRVQAAAVAAQQAQLDEQEARLQQGWDELQAEQPLRPDTALRLERQRWRRRRALERAALRLERREVAASEQRLNEVRALLLKDKAAWDEEQRLLAQELQGLNSRVVHLHEQLALEQAELERLDALLGERRTPPAPAEADHTELLLVELERLTDELADQRLCLLDQWQRLAQARALKAQGRPSLGLAA